MISIKIKDKIIEKNHPCFIIAEAGVNHNGSLKLAKKMIDVAKEAGADAVKFQTFKAENVARKKKPIILSTGMATLDEVKKAVNTIKKLGNNKIILLHCTTNYPCPLGEVNLKAMLTLKKEFNLPVGYSDHTLGVTVPIMAVIMGAQVLEKHFTLDKNLPGPDHKASLEPKELKEMVEAIRNTKKALGNGVKKPTRSEEKIKKVVRKSIVAKINIPFLCPFFLVSSTLSRNRF